MTLEIILILIGSGLFFLSMALSRGRRHDDALALIDGWARNNQCSVVSVRRAPFWSLNAFVIRHSTSGGYRVTFRDQRGDLIHGWASRASTGLLDDPAIEVKLDW